MSLTQAASTLLKVPALYTPWYGADFAKPEPAGSATGVTVIGTRADGHPACPTLTFQS